MNISYSYKDFSKQQLAKEKSTALLPSTVSVVLPARDEAATIGPIVDQIRTELIEEFDIVDELVVMNDGSQDRTAEIAASAGAKVYHSHEILPEYTRHEQGAVLGGKGETLWKSLLSTSGDIILWCDADIANFDTRFIVGSLGPLLTNDEVGFVKGFYKRPLVDNGRGGGRVTELLARPLIATLFPQLKKIMQPLSGEFGGRRSLLESVPFSRGYAVDLGLLIDLTRTYGEEIITQVDLGTRIHRNRSLGDLGPQATAILAMALQKTNGFSSTAEKISLSHPVRGEKMIQVGELPALASLVAESSRKV